MGGDSKGHGRGGRGGVDLLSFILLAGLNSKVIFGNFQKECVLVDNNQVQNKNCRACLQRCVVLSASQLAKPGVDQALEDKLLAT